MVAAHGHGDRLSALPDETLIRILSHLGSIEAARTSALSCRWSRLHAAVPVVDLVDSKTGTWCHDGPPGGRQPACFDHQVNSALLCRDPSAPIRAFRLVVCHTTTTLLDQWISIALTSGVEELDVKLKYRDFYDQALCPFGPYEEPSADFNLQRVHPYVRTPADLFRCRTLRRLRLTNWTLGLPPRDAPLESLDTLFLKRIMAPQGALQRLISLCPRLADLTLEECPSATEVTVASAHLRRFAMACCHHCRRVELRTPCLRSLRYKGGLPGDTPFFSPASHATITAMSIDICEHIDGKKPHELHPITKQLMGRCTSLASLHLSLRPAMAYHSSQFTAALRGLPRLRRLELRGCMTSDHSVCSVAVLLQSTENLEVLSLFPLPPDPPKKTPCYFGLDGGLPNGGEDDDDDVDYNGDVHVPNRLWWITAKCLERRLRRINLIGYRGRQLERILAKFLLSKAQALEEFSVTSAPGRSLHKDAMARELAYWRSNYQTRVTCA
ncbi:hypothetical protein ACP70R_005171 [Stipagrostis hirtigluma subsp. patula]